MAFESHSTPLRAFMIATLAGAVAAGAYGVGNGASTSDGSASPTTDPATQTTTFTTADAGSCLTWQVAEDGTISGFEQADCNAEHRFEVSLREDLATYPTSEFGPEAPMPNQTRQAQLREELCGAATLRYLDGKYDPNGRYSIAPILPPADAWEHGDRTMLCGLQETNRAGEPILTSGRVADQDQARLFEPGQCVAIDAANSLSAVECTKPHQLEITSSVNLAEAFPDHTPSIDEQNTFLGDRCTTDAHDYLGSEENLYQISLRPFWTTQSAASWEGGSRSVNCSLMFSRPEGQFATLEGSAKGGKEQLLIDGTPPPDRPARRPLREEALTPRPTDPAALQEPNPATEAGFAGADPVAGQAPDQAPAQVPDQAPAQVPVQ